MPFYPYHLVYPPLSVFTLFTPFPVIAVVVFVHHSAQQRSSQTNKSQSSAGNQVSICHILCVTQIVEYKVEAVLQDGRMDTAERVQRYGNEMKDI